MAQIHHFLLPKKLCAECKKTLPTLKTLEQLFDGRKSHPTSRNLADSLGGGGKFSRRGLAVWDYIDTYLLTQFSLSRHSQQVSSRLREAEWMIGTSPITRYYPEPGIITPWRQHNSHHPPLTPFLDILDGSVFPSLKTMKSVRLGNYWLSDKSSLLSLFQTAVEGGDTLRR